MEFEHFEHVDKEKMKKAFRAYIPKTINPLPVTTLIPTKHLDKAKMEQLIEACNIFSDAYRKLEKKMRNPFYRFWWWLRNKIEK